MRPFHHFSANKSKFFHGKYIAYKYIYYSIIMVLTKKNCKKVKKKKIVTLCPPLLHSISNCVGRQVPQTWSLQGKDPESQQNQRRPSEGRKGEGREGGIERGREGGGREGGREGTWVREYTHVTFFPYTSDSIVSTEALTGKISLLTTI